MKNNQLRQVVFPILAAFIWGTAFVAQDVCADAMGAFTFNGTRYYIAVLSLLVVLAVSSGFRKDRPQISPAEKKAQRRQLWLGGFCCGTVLAIASNFQQAGLVAGTDGGKAGFITALYVVLVPVFGLFFRRRVSLPVWIAVALSVGALYLLCIKGSFSLAPGDLLVLVCAICFSVHILVIDHFTATCDGVKLSCLQFLFAGTWSTILALFFDTISFQVLLDCIWPLLYVGVFSCGVGYTLQILAQKGSNPTVVTILLSLESVFAVIAGAVVLHQQMTAREYLGCVHILVIDHFTATCDGVKLSCLQFLFAGTWSTILALFFDTISFQVLLDCIWPLLYVGVFSCGVGYTLQILAQKGSNPTVVTILLSLESVFAVIAGAVVLHQQMTAREYLGCVLMFAAVILAQIPMPQKKKLKAE